MKFIRKALCIQHEVDLNIQKIKMSLKFKNFVDKLHTKTVLRRNDGQYSVLLWTVPDYFRNLHCLKVSGIRFQKQQNKPPQSNMYNFNKEIKLSRALSIN